MPVVSGCEELFWNYRSATKFFRRTKQQIGNRLWLVVDREYDWLDKVYKYKMVLA